MLPSLAARYRRELLESVIPFWLRHSLDREHGGYFTCLDRDGTVYDTRKYIWLNGRNTWVFSRLYNEVEPRPEWLDAARLGAEFLRRHARDAEGRVYFSLTREGQPVFLQRKPYAAVFVMMGLLEYARAAQDETYRQEALTLYDRVLHWIEHPEELGRPALPGQVPMSQLSDILVKAMMTLELMKDHQDARYGKVLEDCFTAMDLHYDPARRLWRENALLEGNQDDLPEGRLFSPGSAVEVAWFLLHALEQQPDAGRLHRLLEGIEGSLEFGWDRDYGGLFYFMDVEGKPLLPLEGQMKLWWPHTEAIYATLLAYSLTQEDKWLEWLARLDDYAFRHFADPEFGEWFGYCDRQGHQTSLLKGNHYKGAYHVTRFLLFSLQRLEAMGVAPLSNTARHPA